MNEHNVIIREQLKEKLNAYRYEHVLGVAYMSVALAMRWGADIAQAELAGLLHDCAKYMTVPQMLESCRQYGIALTDDELRAPGVIHAKLGAVMARAEYGVQDEAVLSAIRWHTTGRPDMSLLDKIVYVADYIEPGRRPLPRLDAYRKLAFTDLDRSLVEIMGSTLAYLERSGGFVDGASRIAYNYYKSALKQEQDFHDQ